MSNVLKRSLSLLLAFVMLVGMVPVGVLAEEVEEVSEEVVEEVYEEVAEEAEEEVYEDVYEEAEEEVVEEVVEEVEEEATLPALVGVVKDNVSNAAVAVDEAEEADGLIWLDKNKQNELVDAVMQGKMRDIILRAVYDETVVKNGNVKVYYEGLDVSSFGGFNLFSPELSTIAGLADKIQKYQPVTYAIKGGGFETTVVVVSKNFQHLSIAVGDPEIASAGVPADLTAAVDGMKGEESFQILFSGKPVTALSLKKVQFEELANYAEITKPENWPAKGQSKTYNNVWKISITDDLGVCEPVTAYVPMTVRDTTNKVSHTYNTERQLTHPDTQEVITVSGTFPSDGTSAKTYEVYEGDEVPKPEDPTNQYYTFNGWEKDGDNFKAKWVVKKDADKNNNGIADVDDSYVVKFYASEEAFDNEDEPVSTLNVKYGRMPSAPSREDMQQYAPKDKELDSWVAPDGTKGVSRVTGEAAYYAEWRFKRSENAVTIKYHFYDPLEDETYTEGEHYVMVEAVFDEANGKYKAPDYEPYEETTFDDTVYLGWYEKDGDQLVKYQHDKLLTADEAKALVLYRTWGEDKNNNNIEDGTKDDRYRKFVYTICYENSEVTHDVIVWRNDYNTDEEYLAADPTRDYQYAVDSYNDNRFFMKWQRVNSEVKEYSETYTYIPVFGDDRNHNGYLDSDEVVVVKESGAGNGTVTVDGKPVGKLTVYNGYLFEYRNDPSLDKNVDAKSPEKDAFLRDAKGTVSVKVKPDAGYYVESVLINGAVPEDISNDESDLSVTFTIPADISERKTDYKLEINYASSQFEKLADTLTLDVTDLFGAANKEETVYTKLFKTPAYNANAVQMKYLAREAFVEKVYVNDVKEALAGYESVYAGLWDSLSSGFGIKKDEGGYYYEINLAERWEDINTSFGAAKDPVAVVKNYFAGLKTLSIEDLADFSTVLGAYNKRKALTDELEVSGIHDFAAVAGTEQLKVSYRDSKQSVSGEFAVTVTDNRVTSNITGPDTVTVTYGADDQAILSHFQSVQGVTLKILVGASAEPKNAGTYDVVIGTDGSQTHKPATKAIKVIVEPVKITVTVDSVDTTPNTETEPNKVQTAMRNALKIGGTSNVSDIEMIQVIAGLDMTGFSVNMGKPIVADLKANAWIKIPESIAKIMDVLGYDVRTPRENWTLDKLYTVLTENQEVRNALEAIPQLNGKLDKILSALDKIRAWVGVDMDVYFGEDIYPENPGFYVNLAAVIDPNYEVTNDSNIASFKGIDVYGNYALVHPFLTKPNQGIEFVLNNKAENVFAFNTPDEVKELKVVDAKGKEVKATVYYYGIDRTTGEVTLCGTEMPQTSGLYIASAVLLNQNQQMIGSDLAVVVIGVYDATVEVKKTIVVDDDKLHNPEIIVTNKKTGEPVKASLAVISGTVKDAVSGELSINSFEGEVTFNIPERLGIWWNRFADEVNSKKYYDLPETVPYYSDVKVEAISVSAKYVKKFLEYCIDHVEQPADILAEYIGAEYVNMADQYITYAENQVVRVCNYLLEQVNRIDPKELPNVNVSLEFGHYINTEKNYKAYDENGIYLYLVMVADRDYMPAVDANFLVIQGAEDSLMLTNEMVPYDGKEHELEVTDTTNRDGFRFIIDRQNNTVNLLFDDEVLELAKSLCKKVTGKEYSIENKTFTLAQLMDAIEEEFNAYVKENQGKVEAKITRAEYLAKTFVDEMKSAIESKSGIKVNTDAAMDKLGTTKEAALKVLENKVAAVLKELEKMQAEDPYKDIPITINGKKPVDVGTYEFHAFSYNIVHAQGFLTIAPITMEVVPMDADKTYGEADPDWTQNGEVRFFSYRAKDNLDPSNWVRVDEDGDVEKLTITDEMKKARESLIYSLSRETDNDNNYTNDNAGEYTINLTVNGFNNEDGIINEVVLANNIFTIHKAVVEVSVDANVEAYYGDSYEIKHTIPENAPDIAVTYIYYKDGKELAEKPVNAGDYTFTAVGTTDSQNHDVTFVYPDGAETGKLVIKPAELTITVGTLEKQFDLEADPDFTNAYTTKVENGVISEELLKALVITVARKSEKPDEEKLGDTAVLTATYEKNDNIKVTVVDGLLKITLGEYVCRNTTTREYYKIVNRAVHEAKRGETIEMLKDSDQTKLLDEDYAADEVSMTKGVTLDLQKYTLKLNALVATKGNYVTASYLTDGDLDRDFGKLVIYDPDSLIIKSACTKDNKTVIPVWNPKYDPDPNSEEDVKGCYVFSQIIVNTNKNSGRGLFVDEDAKAMAFYFRHAATGAVNTALLGDGNGSEDNRIQVRIQLRWNMLDEKGNIVGERFQNFVYEPYMVDNVAAKKDRYYYTMTGYDTLNMNLDELKIEAMVVADCGAAVYSDLWTGDMRQDFTYVAE